MFVIGSARCLCRCLSFLGRGVVSAWRVIIAGRYRREDVRACCVDYVAGAVCLPFLWYIGIVS